MPFRRNLRALRIKDRDLEPENSDVRYNLRTRRYAPCSHHDAMLDRNHIYHIVAWVYIDAISKVSVTVTVHRRCRYRVTVSTCAAHVLYTQRLRACKSHISTVRVCLCLISGKCVVCAVSVICSVHPKNFKCVYLLLQNTNHILNSHNHILCK